MSPKVLYITGYARSGKSSLLALLPGTTVSTSAYLSLVTLSHYGFTPDMLEMPTPHVKGSRFETTFFNSAGKTFREAKIYVAEQVLVPSLGRYEGLVRPAIANKMAQIVSEPNLIVCEVLNLEELKLWQRALEFLDAIEYVIQVRSRYELTGVDTRQPIGYRIDNDGTKAQLLAKVLNHVGLRVS